jgi:hypothetical protein
MGHPFKALGKRIILDKKARDWSDLSRPYLYVNSPRKLNGVLA